MKKRCFTIAIAAFIAMFSLVTGAFFAPVSVVYAAADSGDLERTIEALINWKKGDVGSEPEKPLLNNRFLELAGSTPGDWFPIGLGRYGYADDYEAYLAVVTDFVNKKYTQAGKLHVSKATEWHRISLAVTAAGGNPSAMGEFEGGRINLIADGTYDRGLTTSPGRQGINGWIWALIALDGKRYEVPEGAANTRQDFIREILKAQLPDGGLALSGSVSDPDVTAMAIQALAPYYNSEIVYEYTSTKIKRTDEDGNVLYGADGKPLYAERKRTVREVVDEGIAWLSSAQEPDGDYKSWGLANLESGSQVVTALTALGIDPLTDSRFVKDGRTLLDGIMKYRLDDGGFLHSFEYDPDNPASLPDRANSTAGEQALCALVSLWRNRAGMRTLFDMRAEFTQGERSAIDAAETAISGLTEASAQAEVSAALERYVAVDETNRCYVGNYWNLSPLAKKFGLELPAEELLYSGNDSGATGIITHFMPGDADRVLELPATEGLTTEHYVRVVTLFEKLKNAKNRAEYRDCYAILERAYNQICSIQAEIQAIKAEIRAKLYPFEKIGLNRRGEVLALYARFTALSEYDRTAFEAADVEGLNRCKTQVDNLLTSVVVGCVCGAAVVGAAIFAVLHIRNRKRKKLAKLVPESEE